jgi:thiol-disulfide isomerase/thioredoxin
VDYLKIAGKEKQGSPRDQAKLQADLDESLGRAYLVWARALEGPAAVEKGETSFKHDPTPEAARFLGELYAKLNRPADAVARYADAFAADSVDRERIRQEMGAVYQKWKNTQTGLGDEVLKAFDRSGKVAEDRRAALRRIDPNYGIDEPLEFTLSGLTDEKLELQKLRGKVVVFDFWATWCGPCRAQQPLYEQVKERFKANPRVVFLNLNTDEERAGVKPFLETNKWSKTIWFDDGLSSLLKVSSIPTTIIFNAKGELVSRMNGFIADRFVDMLSERIEQALAE